MPDEENRLARDAGWIVGLGLLGVVAGFLCDPGAFDERLDVVCQDPLAYLLYADSDNSCRDTD